MDNQRVLIALREFRASDAVTPYLLGKTCFVCIRKPQTFEEKGLIGEHEDPLDTEGYCLAQTAFDHLFPDSQPLVFFPDREGTDLGKVFPQHVKGAYSFDGSLFFGNDEIPDILIEFVDGPRDHLFLAGKFIDQFLDLFGISNDGFSYLQNIVSLPELQFYCSLMPYSLLLYETTTRRYREISFSEVLFLLSGRRA